MCPPVTAAPCTRAAPAAGNGAALYLLAGLPGSMTILHSSLAGLAQPGVAAMHIATGMVGITNTIIADFAIGISRTAGTVYEDYNLFSGVPALTAGGVTSGGHSFSGNAGLAAPANDDYHLRAGSAAIDAGVDAGVASGL